MASQRLGEDIIKVATSRLGQRYVLGAHVPKDNPNWRGPWDCAEFASWCAWQAYRVAFGMRPLRADRGDAYSGFWYDDASEPGVAIRWQNALNIPGALLVRRPRPGTIGHVAISLGDGRQTIEARGAKLGVGIFDAAALRPWDIGVLLPGVDYSAEGVESMTGPADFEPAPVKVPAGFFALQSPHLKGPEVLLIQRALVAKGIDPGPLDGDFGPMTEAAVVSLQAAEGLEVDGIVGPSTAGELGLPFPIRPSPDAIAALAAERRAEAEPLPQPVVVAAAGKRDIIAFIKDGARHSVRFGDGTTRFVGVEVPYTDDMPRRGLYQDSRLSAIADVGIYAPADFLASHGQWAHFMLPTIKAESSGYFGRLNSYDRAAFTFGAPQFAAHTPKENLIELVRLLLVLPEAKVYLPELALVGGLVTWIKPDGSRQNLEEEVRVTRPHGVVDTQLAHFMRYLNADPVKVGPEEVSAGARLMAFAKEVPAARAAQIDYLRQRMVGLVARAKRNADRFTGQDWRIAVWVVDILYQGRGSMSAIRAALASGNPLEALSKIGSSYTDRRKTVREQIAALDASGVLDGFTV